MFYLRKAQNSADKDFIGKVGRIMTGLENITGQIKKEAEKAAEEIIRDAEKKAAEYIENAKAESLKIAKAAEEKSVRRAADLTARMTAADELKFSRSVLLKKQEIIRDICVSAKAELASLEKDEYFDFLTKLLDVYSRDTQGEIMLTAADKARITAEFEKAAAKHNLTVSEESIDTDGGFILVYGSIEINCTLDALFDSYNEELTDMLNGFLFEGGE